MIESGDEQTAGVETALPSSLEVRVVDDAGRGVRDVEVTWSPASDHGSITPEVSTTNGAGKASSSWTLGATAGPHTAFAAVSDVDDAEFQATAVSDAPPVESGTLEISPTELALDVGQTADLSVIALDGSGDAVAEPGVVWSSLDAAIAVVSESGTVTAHAEGTARIVAAADCCSSDSVFVDVSEAPPVEPGTLEISPTELALDVGQTADLSVIALDGSGDAVAEPGVVWSSLDAAIAVVSESGTVTAQAEGTARIVAAADCCSSDSVVVDVSIGESSGAGLIFRSDWSTAIGSSPEATSDGGAWTHFYCHPDMRALVQEVVGAPTGWTRTPNVLQMTMDGENCALIQNQTAIPAGADYWLRLYTMVLDADRATTNHPYKQGWRGSNSIIMWSLQGRDAVAQSYTPAIRVDPTRWVDGRISQSWAINFVGPRLPYGEFFRFEHAVEYVGDPSLGRSRVFPRIYDMAGNLIADEHDFVHYTDPWQVPTTLAESLADGAYFQHSEVDGTLLGHIHWPAMGYEGPRGNPSTGERYFFADFAASIDGWIGNQ